MSSTTAERSHATTGWGGGALAVGAVIEVFAYLPFPHVTSAAVWSAASALVVLVAAIVLAVGVRGDGGIVGRSVLGRVALILFGAQGLAFAALGAFVVNPLVAAVGLDDLSGALIVPFGAVIVLFTAATIVAGVIVVRAGVIHGVARWMLLVVAGCATVLAVIQLLPAIAVQWVPALLWVGWLPTIALLATGLSYALYGRSDAIRARAREFNEKW